MNLIASIAIKIVITAFFFGVVFFINRIIPGITPAASAWMYTAVGLTGYLMFGILFDRLSTTGWARFLGFNFILIVVLLLVSFISLFGVFTGPAGYFCGWPAFMSALIIFTVTVLGCMGLMVDDSERYSEYAYGT